MKEKIPPGFWIGRSHGDGNCLFNSASIALFGSDAHSSLLRLAAVCNGVEHFDHYLEMVCLFLIVANIIYMHASYSLCIHASYSI